MHPLPLPLHGGEGGRFEPPTKFSKRGDLTGPYFLEGIDKKERGDLFEGGGRGLQFLCKK